jgi:lipid-binding SYLF domain-containing protein
MKRNTVGAMIVGVVAAMGFLGGCTTAPQTEAGRAALAARVDGTLGAMKQANMTLDATLGAAAGYAVFPKVGKGAIWLGAAYGKGELFSKGSRQGYCDLFQMSLGFQAGGQGYSQVLVFETQEAFDAFKQGKFRFAANASAVVLTAGAGVTAPHGSAVSTYVADPAGFMYEAALGFQSYRYVEK